MARPKIHDETYSLAGIRMEERLRTQVKQEARRNRRSFSAEANVLIEEALTRRQTAPAEGR